LLNVGIALLSTCIAVLQVGIYNFAAADAETAAHYCEFTFAILSAFITFAFCMDNKAAADEEMNAIMYGNHRDCESCTSRASELRGASGGRRPAISRPGGNAVRPRPARLAHLADDSRYASPRRNFDEKGNGTESC